MAVPVKARRGEAKVRGSNPSRASTRTHGLTLGSSAPGEFILIFKWAIRLTSCFVYSVPLEMIRAVGHAMTELPPENLIDQTLTPPRDPLTPDDESEDEDFGVRVGDSVRTAKALLSQLDDRARKAVSFFFNFVRAISLTSCFVHSGWSTWGYSRPTSSRTRTRAGYLRTGVGWWRVRWVWTGEPRSCWRSPPWFSTGTPER